MEKLFNRLEDAVVYFNNCKDAIEYSFTHICMNDVIIAVSLCDDDVFKKAFETLSNAIIVQLAKTDAILSMLDATITTYKGQNVDINDPVFNALIASLNDGIREYDSSLAEFLNIVSVNTNIITTYLEAYSTPTTTSIC